LDTNHLINISKVRNNKQLPDGQSVESYTYIDNCIKSWCGLIFNHISPIEWLEGAATLESAEKIAAVIESAKLKYLLTPDYLIFTREILDECLRINPTLKVPKYPVFQSLHNKQTFKSPLGIVANEIKNYFTKQEVKRLGLPDFIPIDVPVISISKFLQETIKCKYRKPNITQERINGFKAALLEDIKRKDEYFENPALYRARALKHFLKIDRILAVNPGIDIDNILRNINFDNCPAINLYWKVRENRMKSGRAPDDNDVDDYYYLPAIPYVDIALIEGRLRNHIIQANESLKEKVFNKPEDAVKYLKGKYTNEK